MTVVSATPTVPAIDRSNTPQATGTSSPSATIAMIAWD